MHDQYVYVVDDDPSVRKAVGFAASSAGLPVRSYCSAEDFLAECTPDIGGCIVLDMDMPGKGGLDLQATLAAQGIEIPIVFLTGHGTISTCTRAMQGRAVDFIEKPCDTDRLLDSINRAFERDRQFYQDTERREVFAEYYELLTDREKEAMELLVAGLETKEIAAKLGIVARTVDNHRVAVFKKMRVENVVGLTHFVLSYRDGMNTDDLTM